MASLKEIMVIVEKLNLDPSKISVNKKVFQEVVNQAKNLSYAELLKKKNECFLAAL